MPLYQYKALSAAGKAQAGVIDADSIEVAKSKLRLQKLLITSIQIQKRQSKQRELTQKELLTFTRDVYQLLRSGLPLYESLVTICEKSSGDKVLPIYLDIADQVKQGKSLSSVLGCYPKSFNQIYVSMVGAAEESGNLDQIFKELSIIIARDQRLKNLISQAMTYPTFLGVFSLAVLVALFTYLIPSMKELLEGRNLNPLTQKILSISYFMESHKLAMGLFLLFVAATLIWLFKSEKGSSWLKVQLVKVPIFRKLMTQNIMMRFCRTLSTLLTSGIPLVDALKLSKQVMNHPSFETIIDSAQKRLVEGKKLSSELGQSKLIPTLVIRMISTAEEAGDTPGMLRNIAEIYEEDLEKTLAQFTSLLQPVMLIVLGIIIAIILLAVLLPMTDVSSFM
ncbi:MAG: Type II secretion system protein F [Chlamydiia bacterium]|nr:Type II secretion system protein F [Chlamydiia bacterium]